MLCLARRVGMHERMMQMDQIQFCVELPREQWNWLHAEAGRTMSNKAAIVRGLIDRAMSTDQRITPVPPADGARQKYCLAISRKQWAWLHGQVTPRLSKVDIVRGLIAQSMGGAGSD